MRFKKILLATDLSDRSRRLIDGLRAVPRTDDATILLAFADATPTIEAFSADAFSDLHRRIAEAATIGLEAQLADLEAHGFKVQAHIVNGGPREAISGLTESHECDLIVLGMSSRATRSGLFVGSTTRWVLRQADVPVLTVPIHGENVPTRWSRVATTTDFSDDSDVGVGLATSLAQQLSAAMNVIHVVELPRFAAFGTISPSALPTEQRQQLEELQRGRLAQIYDQITEDTLHTVVSSPHVPEGIIRAATEWGADVVVVPSHGKGAVRAMLLGSTSERLVELSPVPVLILPRAFLKKRAAAAAAAAKPAP